MMTTGLLTRSAGCIEHFDGLLRQQLAGAGRLDGVCFAVHGAMAGRCFTVYSAVCGRLPAPSNHHAHH